MRVVLPSRHMHNGPVPSSSHQELAYVPKIVHDTTDKILQAGFGKKVTPTHGYDTDPAVTNRTPLERLASSVYQLTGDLNQMYCVHSDELAGFVENRKKEYTRRVDATWSSISERLSDFVEHTQDCYSRIKSRTSIHDNMDTANSRTITAQRQERLERSEADTNIRLTESPSSLLQRLQDAKPLRTGVLTVVRTMANIILPRKESQAQIAPSE